MGSKKFVEYLILNLSFQRDTMDFSRVSDGFLKIITILINWFFSVRISFVCRVGADKVFEHICNISSDILFQVSIIIIKINFILFIYK